MSEQAHEQALADEQLRALLEQHRAAREQLPGWVGPALRLLPHVLITVTLLNLLIGLVAVVTPYLARWFGPGVADPIYGFYALLCPQRHSHTWFFAGHPMAFEQRDVAMYIAFGLAGLVYALTPRLRRPLAGRWLLLGIAPLLIDVAISTLGILPSTWFSRLWTGSLASFVIVWWSYPRYDAYLRRVQTHVARLSETTVPDRS